MHNGVKVTLTDKVEGALASQELRQAFFVDKWAGLELTPEREARIQPANYDIVIEDKCWRVPNGFRPDLGVSVLESLRRLNPRDRKEYVMNDGVVITPGFSYLFPLEGNWNVPKNFFIRASPKSTEGRMFNFVRLIADGMPGYDEVGELFRGKLYALVRPLAFHNLVFPGFAFTQLRAYCRRQCILPDEELVRLVNQQHLVKRNNAVLQLDEIKFNNGLLLTADLEGEESGGVVGFRCRPNPDPVDRRAARTLDWAQYFEPVFAPPTKTIDLKKGEFYLMHSREWVEMTPTHAGIMTYYRPDMMENRSNAAGYFDANRFVGVATLEIPVIDETIMYHGAQFCAIQFEHVRATPDKEYRGGYHSQKFALIPKPFTLPDLTDITRKTASERELIMYVNIQKLFGNDYFEGFSPVEKIDFRGRILGNYDFARRGGAEVGNGLEADSTKKQPIAYLVFVNPKERSVFAYSRASQKEKYSETRLYGKLSIGVGGHVRTIDKAAMPDDPLRASLEREVHREETEFSGSIGEPRLIGYINDDTHEHVNSVHFGLLHVIEVDGAVRPKSSELKEGRMMAFDEFRAAMQRQPQDIERWTQIAFDVIEQMYR